ncbi:MAG: tetratricopeptide repeat protein [Pseudomonadota bacterium]
MRTGIYRLLSLLSKTLIGYCVLPMVVSTSAWALDAKAHVEKAIELMEDAQWSLARTYLAPALISPLLSTGERSRAYYLRGYTFLAQDMPVSARKDFNRSLEFAPENPAALVELGRLYADGRGTARDPEQAFLFFETAAQKEHVTAQYYLGRAYLEGLGVDKNVVRARELLTTAAGEGHIFAMLNLAGSYRAQAVADPDPRVAKAWYDKAYNAGEAGALLSLGYMYANGEFGEPEPEKAVEYFQRAADGGVATAAASLAHAYTTGAGVEVDHARAFALYQEAAVAGVTSSYVGLGYLYEEGLGVNRSEARALEWYGKGAAAGDLNAHRRLVGHYLSKPGLESRKKALYWSRLAAEGGSAQARNDYAWLLATSKDAELRNGTLAVDQALRAVEADAVNPAYLDTLAAAYAETGEFEEAVAAQRQALNALDTGDGEMRADFENRLTYYQSNRAWRE